MRKYKKRGRVLQEYAPGRDFGDAMEASLERIIGINQLLMLL